jgi:hypothetical protein
MTTMSHFLLFINKCRYSSVCVLMGRWAGRLVFLAGALFQSVETSFGAHTSSYSVRAGAVSMGVKWSWERDWPQSSTRNAMCVYRNNEAHSHNHCWRGEAIIIECYDCVCLTCSACKAHAPYYIVICSCLAVPFMTHYLINSTIFRKKLLKFKMYVLLSFCWKHFSCQEELNEIVS